MERDNCDRQFLRKCYRLAEIPYIYTDLITRSALIDDITFLDFKVKNFKIMNNYDYQRKQLVAANSKKEENNQTASRSFEQGHCLQ